MIRSMTGTKRLGVRKAGNSVGKLIMSASMASGSRNVETATQADSENNALYSERFELAEISQSIHRPAFLRALRMWSGIPVTLWKVTPEISAPSRFAPEKFEYDRVENDKIAPVKSASVKFAWNI